MISNTKKSDVVNKKFGNSLLSILFLFVKIFCMNYIVKNNTAHLYLYGTISKYDIDAGSVITALQNAAKEQVKEFHLHINSPGGDVYEGIAIFSALKQSDIPVIAHIDGIAASMASVIIMAAQKRVMSRYARLMTHRVSGMMMGNADDFESVASEMRKLDDDLADIYAKISGMNKEEAREKFLKNTDSYFSAEEAKQYGIVDEIENEAVKGLQNYDYPIFLNSIPKQHHDMKKIATLLGLSSDATEEAIIEAVKGKDKTISDLKNELDTLKQAQANEKIKALIDKAIAEKRITENMRATYEALAKSDYESTKKVLESMQSGQIQIQNSTSKNDRYKDWTFADYQKKDPKELARIKDEDPEKYKALYKAQFGVEPKL